MWYVTGSFPEVAGKFKGYGIHNSLSWCIDLDKLNLNFHMIYSKIFVTEIDY